MYCRTISATVSASEIGRDSQPYLSSAVFWPAQLSAIPCSDYVALDSIFVCGRRLLREMNRLDPFATVVLRGRAFPVMYTGKY